nr:S-type pyocin domain-containing protein [Rosenbergiella nectarea]
MGGTSDSWDEGRRLAGTLDSVSSCPCGARFIPSISDGYIKEDTPEEQAEKTQWLALVTLQEKQAQQEVEEKQRAEERDRNRVFAKSCLLGEGCNDAGKEPEPHTHFAAMAFYQAIPPSETDVPQHAQTTKKKKAVDDIPKPKKRSALYKWLNGDHEEIDYQRAIAAATSAANAQTAVEGASILGLVGGSAITSGTWAVKLGEMVTGLGRIAASGPGALIAAVVMGMMPGRLNDGEQDYLDRMRLEQMRDAPTRVRYSWEQDDKGNLVPRGWHTPPGKDRVRVRKMAWDSSRKAYTFTTEEEPGITLIWTPDSSGVNVPANTGNPNPVRIPNPVVVDPLPEDSGIEATTSPAPEEKNFADYILILPLSDIPPIYVYLSQGRSGIPDKDHDYYPAPETTEIAISGLRQAKKKTPKQGGSGLRERWVDAKGRRIYEWDSQHGELEEYRASDGEHLRSVDYKTGEQLKPAVKGRNIKRYL